MTVPDFRYKIAAQVAALGCGYLPRYMAESELRAGRLMVKQTAQGYVSQTSYLAWREPVRGRALAWFIQAFKDVRFAG